MQRQDREWTDQNKRQTKNGLYRTADALLSVKGEQN